MVDASSAVTQEIRARVSELLSVWLHNERSRQQTEPDFASRMEYLRQTTRRQVVTTMQGENLSEAQVASIVEQIISSIYGLGALDELVVGSEADKVSNIEIVGFDNIFVSYRDGRGKQKWDKTVGSSDEELIEIFETLATGRIGGRARVWDDKNFVLNYQLASGHRVHAIRNVVLRPTITIRAHDMALARLSDLAALNMLPWDMEEFLGAAVKAELNIVVAGATNTGKTTFLRGLINEVPSTERLITIEDNLELGVHEYEDMHPNCPVMEAIPPNVEGQGGVTIAQLLKESLRMNPDRVIVGEVRGAEVMGMLRAMTQGNDGSMCSIHANDADQSARRLVVYAQEDPDVSLSPEAARERIADAVDLIIHIKLVGGLRHVSEVGEVKLDEGRIGITHVYKMDRPDPDDIESWVGVGLYNNLSLEKRTLCARFLADGLEWFESWGKAVDPGELTGTDAPNPAIRD